MTFTLFDATALAIAAHADQKDQGDGGPYVRHPLRIMEALKPYGEVHQIVGVLHDTIEDTWVTVEYLRGRGASEEIIRALLSVTHDDESEPYEDAIRRAAADPIGRIVKLADNADNSLEWRMAYFPPDVVARRRLKYKKARLILEEAV